jgi:excisionase family DNA binding protein
MEKICIVKRRKNNPHIAGEYGPSGFDAGPLPGSMTHLTTSPVHEAKEVRSESNSANNLVLSLKLTPDQSEIFRSNEIMKTLVHEIAGGVSLKIRQEQGDQYVIDVLPTSHRSINMLTSDQVCQMLQISKSLVRKLVHEKKITSYKVGRLRRFSLDDILAYLVRSEDV